MKRWDCRGIIACFAKKHNTSFFIHFDEVDLVLKALPAVSYEGVDVARRFYDFWAKIDPILRTLNFLYCSGRSAVLYAMGKGLYHSVGIESPGKNLL